MPLLSVIIPVYNGEYFIQEAIESVFRQGYPHLEVLVVDDGSTDETALKVKSFKERVRYFHQENQGPGVARNMGIKNTSGEILSFLDVDDLWPESRLNMLMKKFEENPDLEIVLGHTISEALPGAGKVEPNFLKPYVIPSFGSGLFKREVFKKVGMIDAELRFSEDQDWFMRTKEQNVAMIIIKDVVLIQRIHGNNMTKNTAWKDVDILKVIKKSLDRRRKGGKDPKELPKLSDYREE